MLGWLNRRKDQKARAEELRQERVKLVAAVNTLDHKRNHIEQLMAKMLEERRA